MEDMLRLSDVVDQLRDELRYMQAKADADGESFRFGVSEAEVELQVVASTETGGRGGMQVWVVSAEAAHSVTRGVTHTLRLKLVPRDSGGSGEVRISRGGG